MFLTVAIALFSTSTTFAGHILLGGRTCDSSDGVTCTQQSQGNNSADNTGDSTESSSTQDSDSSNILTVIEEQLQSALSLFLN